VLAHWGGYMKKIAIALVAAAIAVTPALAEKKKKMSEAEAQRDASWRLVKASLPFFIPSVLKPIYFKMQEDEAKKHKNKK
jgi:hypothetical protein